MVARMILWPLRSPAPGKKVRVRVVVRRAEGLKAELGPVAAEVRWKEPRAALRRKVKRNRTRAEAVGFAASGVVEWNEEFESECSLTANKDGALHPWEIVFSILYGMNQSSKGKESIIGMGSLNLAEYVPSAEEDVEIDISLPQPGVSSEAPLLRLSLNIVELKATQEASETMPRCIMPFPFSPPPGDVLHSNKDEVSALKARLRKVKLFPDFVSTRRNKKTCRDDEGSEGRFSGRSDDVESSYPFDTDSLDDDMEESCADDDKEGNNIRKSFSYGTLASTNSLGCPFSSNTPMNGEYEDWIYYSHRKSDANYPINVTSSSVPEQSAGTTSKRSILSWKKRKLSFRSPKDKGEPLLNKSYGEEGGDDIDYDRRQLSSDESLYLVRHKMDDESIANRSSISDFGDDSFVVGCWEPKEVTSRDGKMKMSTQVFFASIDQRSERAAGESACTALVAVIADWFQNNHGVMPIKSQFDSLIRDGSLEWRNLCEKQTYRERFPDKHFDLDSVLEAKIRSLSVNPDKSFIGFFQPDCSEEISGFGFLDGAMSFDSIWDEISRISTDNEDAGKPRLYIVSWNDHFFVLMIEKEAYYIIDTLGERLYEGCDQAYILKFNDTTVISRLQNEDKAGPVDAVNRATQQLAPTGTEGSIRGEQDNRNAAGSSSSASSCEEIVCKGKESCKEYIKSFLAAIPIRELQNDIKKGLMASTPLHHRLQIEFHYAESSCDGMPSSFFPSLGGFSSPPELESASSFFSLQPATSLKVS